MKELSGGWAANERWFVGLLWGDGHLAEDGVIHLSLAEEELVSAAAQVVGRPYRTYPQRPRNGRPRRPLHRLFFTDHVLAGQLRALGFGLRSGRAWPVQLASAAFLRGLFDGNGWAGWHYDPRAGRSYLNSTMSGSPPLLTGMQAWLAGQGIAPKTINRNGSGWQVRWSQRDSVRLAGIMYSEPGPFRARNRGRFRGPGQ